MGKYVFTIGKGSRKKWENEIYFRMSLSRQPAPRALLKKTPIFPMFFLLLAHFLHAVYLGTEIAYVRPIKHCLDILTFSYAIIMPIALFSFIHLLFLELLGLSNIV